VFVQTNALHKIDLYFICGRDSPDQIFAIATAVLRDRDVRDSGALAALDIGVKALGVTPRKSVRRGEGSVNLRNGFAGVHFDDGDVLIADEDGMIVLTKEQARE
jgi:regulator of RNase E activity RraA